MKMKLIIIVILTVFASVTAVGCMNLTGKTPVATSEAAVQIAKDALSARFPDENICEECEFEAYDGSVFADSVDKEDFDFSKHEKDGVWVVLARIPLPYEERLFTFGGGYSVIIRKTDGKILKAQVDE
ncbi:MAG: hypothetical protein FWG42_09620 [Clostridiales bacterium]|nr:hypothetical protein [Clostridiales bacterium]